MAGYGGGHPNECPKCGAPPWESCFANDDCLRTVSADMRGETHSYQPKLKLANNVEDKHGFAPCQFDLKQSGYWKHSGNGKLYEIVGFTFLWTEEWGIKYKALGEDVEHTQPAKRFFGVRDGVLRFEPVSIAQAMQPDPTAYRMDAENVDSDYAKIYSQYPIEKPYAGEETPMPFTARFLRWFRGN